MAPPENTPDPKVADKGAAFPPELVDEYEIIRPLGQGAMGQVYQAVDTLLGRPVAVKFIAQESSSATARERFLVEARAIARLQHPNVVSIYRVGVVDGWPYLVSELVRGQSLDRVALPLSWQRALDIAVQLARGLAAAHSQGVLHRDIKPPLLPSENSAVRIWGKGRGKKMCRQTP